MSVTVQQITTIRHEFRVANPSGHSEMQDAMDLASRHAAAKKMTKESITVAADSMGLVVFFDETLQALQRPEGAPENAVLRQ